MLSNGTLVFEISSLFHTKFLFCCDGKNGPIWAQSTWKKWYILQDSTVLQQWKMKVRNWANFLCEGLPRISPDLVTKDQIIPKFGVIFGLILILSVADEAAWKPSRNGKAKTITGSRRNQKRFGSCQIKALTNYEQKRLKKILERSSGNPERGRPKNENMERAFQS